MLIWQTPTLCARGQRGEREQAHFPMQNRRIKGRIGQEVVVGFEEVVVVVQQLGVEYFKQFIPFWFRLAERLDRVAGGEVLEVEVRGMGQSGLERTDREVVGVWRGDLVGGDGA